MRNCVFFCCGKCYTTVSRGGRRRGWRFSTVKCGNRTKCQYLTMITELACVVTSLCVCAVCQCFIGIKPGELDRVPVISCAVMFYCLIKVS